MADEKAHHISELTRALKRIYDYGIRVQATDRATAPDSADDKGRASMSTQEPWYALYYHGMSLETERFATERDAVMFLHELDYGSPVAVHGPNDYKLGQKEINRRARQFWEAENPEAAEAERRDPERRRQQAVRQAQYEAWLAEQPDWYRTPVESIRVTQVDHLLRVSINGNPLPFQVQHIELQNDAVDGSDNTFAFVLHAVYGDNLTVEYGSHETRRTIL